MTIKQKILITNNTYMKLSFVLLMILIRDLMTFLRLHQFQNLVLEKLYIPDWQ